jgi:hypothetical protein
MNANQKFGTKDTQQRNSAEPAKSKGHAKGSALQAIFKLCPLNNNTFTTILAQKGSFFHRELRKSW